jgi:hypothetical protein
MAPELAIDVEENNARGVKKIVCANGLRMAQLEGRADAPLCCEC